MSPTPPASQRDGQPARLVSVNVGRPRQVPGGQRLGTVRTSIWKQPVAGPVAVRRHNLDGDEQADRGVHGGPDKAVYAYAAEDLDWWAAELGRAVGPGAFGENLTTRGLDLAAAVVGERWRVGTAQLEVCSPRIPCYKLGLRFDDPTMPRRFARAARPGAYLRVVDEGVLAAGDQVTVLGRPGHGVTVGLVERAYHDDHALAAGLLAAPELPDGWREWAAEMAAHRAPRAPSG
jgi:MOSC domain-containing protein YiiM